MALLAVRSDGDCKRAAVLFMPQRTSIGYPCAATARTQKLPIKEQQ